MKTMIQFGLAAILIPVLDYLWLGLLMKDFYLTELGTLARHENGVFKPWLMPAVGVYVALALGITIFVLPQAEGKSLHAFIMGAIFGFITYGVYDLTNLALVQNWSSRMSLVDIAWGTLLCGVVAGIIEALPLSTDLY